MKKKILIFSGTQSRHLYVNSTFLNFECKKITIYSWLYSIINSKNVKFSSLLKIIKCFTVQTLNATMFKNWTQFMTKENQDQFNVLRKIKNKPDSTQRELAKELGFSLGKLNYCLNALIEKGFVKISNFKNNPSKIGYIYILTPKGINKKAKLTLDFMKRKMKEYDELKNEIEKK